MTGFPAGGFPATGPPVAITTVPLTTAPTTTASITTAPITAADGSPLSAKALIRRRRIVEVAIELGTEGGYDAVHMRVVAERAGVALATVYRYFESKDHLLSATVSEWAAEFQSRLVRHPAQGETAAEQLIDVLRRAARAVEGRPLFTAALLRALSSSTPGVATATARVRAQVVEVTAPCLVGMSPAEIDGIVSVLWHVWRSTLIAWASGRSSISSIGTEVESAARLLLGRPLDRTS